METAGNVLVMIFLGVVFLASLLFTFLMVAVPLCFLRMLPYAMAIYLVYLLATWVGVV